MAVVRGWNIAEFGYARAAALASRQTAPAGLARWQDAPGLGEAALEASLPAMSDPTDIAGARARAERLAAIAAVHPLSSANWLALAGMGLVTGQPHQRVLDALAMSALTGPNEGAVMLQRGIFGLLQWERLPADVRQRTASDLAGAILGTNVQDADLLPAKNILREKPSQTRQEVGDLLRADGVPASDLGRIGL
ncbi:MAG TPA: hypothetical protein VGG57_08780 [Stellaceae bacterium]|jgi:hypothetical protein